MRVPVPKRPAKARPRPDAVGNQERKLPEGARSSALLGFDFVDPDERGLFLRGLNGKQIVVGAAREHLVERLCEMRIDVPIPSGNFC